MQSDALAGWPTHGGCESAWQQRLLEGGRLGKVAWKTRMQLSRKGRLQPNDHGEQAAKPLNLPPIDYTGCCTISDRILRARQALMKQRNGGENYPAGLSLGF
jgi:hypothetical protein